MPHPPNEGVRSHVPTSRITSSNVIPLPTAAPERVRQSWRGRYPKTVSRLIDLRRRQQLDAQSAAPGEFVLSRRRDGRLEVRLDGCFSVSKEKLRSALNAALRSIDVGAWDASFEEAAE
ncbi:hypothetical protein [Paraburkholderia sp. UCT2]|uniref:hypothetical protein n=1 Tax=Paraburkholderia sp. UCT2 TaxID=2615208 RepID=UPI0016554718|nr:hypothetical protein [Paraburkholderia sp. UCT2]MBC8730007.1 hypothetical protein [Paraburkholderia sp. UCT2]